MPVIWETMIQYIILLVKQEYGNHSEYFLGTKNKIHLNMPYHLFIKNIYTEVTSISPGQESAWEKNKRSKFLTHIYLLVCLMSSFPNQKKFGPHRHLKSGCSSKIEAIYRKDPRMSELKNSIQGDHTAKYLG